MVKQGRQPRFNRISGLSQLKRQLGAFVSSPVLSGFAELYESLRRDSALRSYDEMQHDIR